MKPFFAGLLSIVLLSFVLAGCKINDCDPDSDRTIRETIRANETFTYDLGSFGDEEGASIVRQAKHYRISRLERQDFSRIVYTYQPDKDFLGGDEVEIKSERGWSGAGGNDRIVRTTFKFTIVP